MLFCRLTVSRWFGDKAEILVLSGALRLDSPSSPTPKKPTAGLLKNPGEQMNGLISFYIGTVVDLSRERFEVLWNSELRVVSAGGPSLLVEIPFEPGQCDCIYINEFSVKAGEDNRIVFSRICFCKEYTLPWGWQ